jgi:hypothetical protein
MRYEQACNEPERLGSSSVSSSVVFNSFIKGNRTAMDSCEVEQSDEDTEWTQCEWKKDLKE